MITTLPSISQAVSAIRSGQLSPVELVEFCLDRIDRLDDKVHAWVRVEADGAKREAERLAHSIPEDKERALLHGIPIAIKDIADVQGWPTECGSVLRAGRVATRDAELVARLRAAGAILLGKTVTTQFASFDPPPTRNPWNLERTPGGSSSGSAAAVATEMCVAALGTQTGGSICRPAAYCGVVGFKPSYGTVPLVGVEPLSWHLDHGGSIARCVDDARILFQVMANAERGGDAEQKPSRLLTLPGFFHDRATPVVRDCFANAVERLRQAGIAVDTWQAATPAFEELLVMHRRVMAVEAATHHRTAFADTPELFGPRIRDLLEEGLRISAVDFAAALQRQSQIATELSPLFDANHILLLPSTTTTAPGIESTGDPAFNSLWSFARVPEVTIPCGLSPDGLPCGIQFVGSPGSDFDVLQLAARCEEVLQFDDSPPLVTALSNK